MPRGRPKKIRVEEPKTEEYTVSVQVGNVTQRATGSQPLEALLKLSVDKYTVKAVVRVEKGERSWELPYRPLFFRRLFSNKGSQELFNGNAIKFLQ